MFCFNGKTKCFAATALVLGFLLVAALENVYAYPALQLDIEGGTYDLATETIVASSSEFTLYALLDTKSMLDPDATYYVSAAISPGLEEGEDLSGTFFSFEGTTLDVIEDMTYGVPPVEVMESLQGHDANDLAQHGIFPTYFSEFSFTFTNSNKAVAYNTQDNPGGFVEDADGRFLYAAFDVDVSGMDFDHVVHFDLYDTVIKEIGAMGMAGMEIGDIDVAHFAPFSHDAESAPIPEPSTLFLLGSGLFGLVGWKRRRNG